MKQFHSIFGHIDAGRAEFRIFDFGSVLRGKTILKKCEMCDVRGKVEVPIQARVGTRCFHDFFLQNAKHNYLILKWVHMK